MVILKDFVRQQGVLDHMSVLAIEKSFELQVGQFRVVGAIDRVDRLDDDTIQIWDYKSNRALFDKSDLDSGLQLSLYQIAAQRIWPWVRKVKLSYWMLRHGIHQHTERTPEKLEMALQYVEALGHETETATESPARLNPFCGWCDYRTQCSAFQEAVKGKRIPDASSPDDLKSVGRELAELATLIKLLTNRKSEVEQVIRQCLKEQDELIIGGIRYAMFPTTRIEYPLEQSVKLLSEATGLDSVAVLSKIAVADKEQIVSLLKTMDKAKANLLRVKLDCIAERTVSQRLWAKKVAE